MSRIIQIIIAFMIMGLFFSSRPVILFLNSLNPLQGLAVYYFILFLTLQILQFFGLVVGGVKMQSIQQTLGQLMIIFAFFIIVDFESDWVAHVIHEQQGTPDNSQQNADYPVIYTQAEDGAVYYLWRKYAKPDAARILTYIITPAILVASGLLLTGSQTIRRDLLA